jgi:hypothetical protein
MMRSKLGILGAATFALVLARPTPSFAGEPGNNTPPWGTISNTSFGGTADVFTTTATSMDFGGDYAITSSTDVDYYIVACGGYQTGNSLGTVKEIKLGFTHAKGDLDMRVYSTDGTMLGGSYGFTDTETYNVAAQKRGAVIIKVYGFNGALNPKYNVILACQ